MRCARQRALLAKPRGVARAHARRRRTAVARHQRRDPHERVCDSNRRGGRLMLVHNLAILVLAGFIGFVVISRVPTTLHTPLMSGTNAIHGIVLLGGLIVLGTGTEGVLNKILLVLAIALGTINVVGGFLVTGRMLGMFKRRPGDRPVDRPSSGADS